MGRATGIFGRGAHRGADGIQLALGGQRASLSLRDAAVDPDTPRGSAVVVAHSNIGPFVLGVRVGRRFSGWSNVDGSGLDLDLGGFDGLVSVAAWL